MFWLIRFGKTLCFKIFSLSLYVEPKTSQHIPFELQMSKWAAGTIGSPSPREDTCSDTTHLPFLLAPFHIPHIPRSCLCMHEVPQRSFSAPGLLNLPFATYYRCLKGYGQARIPRKVGVKPSTLSMPTGKATTKGHTSWPKFCEAFNFQ